MIISGSWPMVPLGEVLTERNEFPLPDELQLGRIPIIAKISFKNGKITFRDNLNTSTGMILIRPGDLVISGINASKGAIAIHYPESTQPIAATIHYSAYQVDSNRADIWYLWWLLRSKAFQEILQERIANGIKSELRSKHLLPIRIPLPSLLEQRKLINLIETVEDRINRVNDAIDEIIAECRNLPDVYLQSIIKHYPERITFENCFSEPLHNGISLKANQIINNGDSRGISFITVGAVSFGYFDTNQIKSVNMALSDDSTYWIEPGDLLMSRGNSPELVGRAAVYHGSKHVLAYPDLIIRIRLDRNNADIDFFEWFLRSHEVRSYIESSSVGTSPTMKKVNHTIVKNIPVPNISTMEQRRIVNYLEQLQSKVRKIITELHSSRSEVGALLTAIFYQIFQEKLYISIPEFALQEINTKRANEIAKYNEELLIPIQKDWVTIQTSKVIGEEFKVNKSEDLTQLLLRSIKARQQPITSRDLWQLSGIPDIDTFYAYLKVEDQARRITEKRVGYEIYLEPANEIETFVD